MISYFGVVRQLQYGKHTHTIDLSATTNLRMHTEGYNEPVRMYAHVRKS